MEDNETAYEGGPRGVIELQQPQLFPNVKPGSGSHGFAVYIGSTYIELKVGSGSTFTAKRK